MKRVGCLYRVSTKKQVYNNDIPVQREACLKYIDKKENWKLEKEYKELGVSGYKLSEKKRDVLQEIKKDVLAKKIDVLLVFLFDRIGRKDDETPLVVRWLIEQGIEVWSVNEGQRVLDDRFDRLINYITYWQAAGESENISLRATEKRIQLIKDGIYMGYYAPYGYEMVESEILSKIGKKRRTLKINPKEAKVIVIIFDLIIDNNYGTDKIAIYLNNKNIERRKAGTKWDSAVILDIVKNPIYKGYVSFMKRTRKKDIYRRNSQDIWIIADKPNEDIIIIPEDRWEKANEIIQKRSRKGERVIRLLSGLTRCGYCREHIVPKGKTKYTYMLCKGKQKTGFCNYNANYRVDILENIVSLEIKQYLIKLKKIDLKKVIKNNNQKITRRKEKIMKISKNISIIENRLEELKAETMRTLLSGDDNEKQRISNIFNNQQRLYEEQKEEKTKLENDINEFNSKVEDIKEFIPNWIQEFENAPFEDKREIVNKIIDKVILYNDKIEICVKYPI